MQNEQKKYAIVKSRRWRFFGRVALPFTIGSDPSNTIIVNSEAAGSAMRIVAAHGERLVYFDPDKERLTDDGFTHAYGFMIKGPFSASLLNMNTLGRWRGELLDYEKVMFARLPMRVRAFLGGFMPQRIRLACWAILAIVLMLSLGMWLFRPLDAEVDSSLTPINAMYASVFSKKVGSVPTHRDLKRGATLQYAIPKESQHKTHVLSFDLKDSDINGEIIIKILDKVVFVSEADKACLAATCPHDVVIPANLMRAESLRVFFQHTMPQSDYVISNIMLEEARPLKAEEQRTVERWLAAAQRNYNERIVAHENLMRAQEELEKVKRVLRTKEGVEDFRAKANSLHQEISAEIENKIKDLWFIAQQQKQLGKYEEARVALRGLKLFIRNPADPRMLQISRSLREAEEFLK